MCGRFSLTKEEQEIERRFNARFYSNDLVKRYNVAPGQLALVITNEKPDTLQLFKWGLIPSWAKDPKIGYMMINAKSETLFEKPSFKYLVRKRRCLVISDGFYEWKPLAAKKKQPYRMGTRGFGLFAFAGLWDAWTDPETGEMVHTFTIITTEANPLVAEVHNRMPVILHEADEQKWLDTGLSSQDIQALLTSYPEDGMERYAVSSLVNSPKNDTEALLVPVTPDAG